MRWRWDWIRAWAGFTLGKFKVVGLRTGAGALGGTGVMAESWPEHVWWLQVRLRTAGKIEEWQNIYIM